LLLLRACRNATTSAPTRFIAAPTLLAVAFATVSEKLRSDSARVAATSSVALPDLGIH
jgi:hypothetical protein